MEGCWKARYPLKGPMKRCACFQTFILSSSKGTAAWKAQGHMARLNCVASGQELEGQSPLFLCEPSPHTACSKSSATISVWGPPTHSLQAEAGAQSEPALPDKYHWPTLVTPRDPVLPNLCRAQALFSGCVSKTPASAHTTDSYKLSKVSRLQAHTKTHHN